MRRGLLLFILPVVATCASCYKPPSDNAFVGSTKEQIIAKLGNPTTQFNGHYGLPGLGWANQHPNCVTLLFEKPGGTLYVTIEPKNGEWIGLRSQWLPEGGAF
ncbi:MAG TPA: hypothetical protein VK797_20840 [Tepidisphaeraceae bacterium]|jgi:hypothetical protein|nr:hypothetical protein [Tepidisphaeraceae bacterium]